MIPFVQQNAPAPGVDRGLLVMLPAAGAMAVAFAEHGMVRALHGRGWPIDVIAADPPLELYLDGSIADTLHEEVVRPALARGYRRLWFLGISLGGMGALLYASAYTASVDGLVLLAPFLGTQGSVAAVAKAGGFAAAAAPDLATTATEKRMLGWLQGFLTRRPARPALYLGYGRTDRFAQGHRMLAQAMPAGDVVTHEGGHDWETWVALWRRLLDVVPLGGNLSGNLP